MSVSPESQSVPIEAQSKRCCPKFRRFELLKRIGGGLLSLSVIGLVISNTVGTPIKALKVLYLHKFWKKWRLRPKRDKNFLVWRPHCSVLIHTSIIPNDVCELQREINDLKAAFDAQQSEIKSLQVKNDYQQEELSDFRYQVQKAAIELSKYKLDTDESFSTVQQNLTEININVENMEIELNQTQVDLENTTVELSLGVHKILGGKIQSLSDNFKPLSTTGKIRQC